MTNLFCKPMKTLVIKGKNRIWPTVTWEGSNFSIQYLGLEDDDVTIKETGSIDFEEFFLHLDKGGSIFLTVKPDSLRRSDGTRIETSIRSTLRENPIGQISAELDQGERFRSSNWESEEVHSWR